MVLHGPRVSWGWGQRGLPMAVPRRPRACPKESWKELYRHRRGDATRAHLSLLRSSPKLDWMGESAYGASCPSAVYVGWPHLPCFAPSLAFVSRWWWLCAAQEKTWAECRSGETEILPPVRRVHGSALSTALKSPLGFARSSRQHNYQIMPPN